MNAPDSRFYEALGPVRLGVLAELAGATCEATKADLMIGSASVLERAKAGTISYLSDRRYAELARSTEASACFVGPKEAELLPPPCVALITPLPQAAWAAAVTRLHRARRHEPGAAGVHADAMLEEGVVVSAGAVVAAGAQIGRGAIIGPNACIGPGVAIGRGAEVGPGVVIGFALIGDNVRILANSVVGEAGFGVALGPKGLIDHPQLGRVIIQDGVSIGACVCVDRGAFDDTVIGENSKIDNLVQVAHNVVIGRNCVVAGHSGLSGSSVLGDGAQLGGRVGLADHVKIGAGARLGAASGVMHDVPAGESWAGIPARPVLQFFRETAWLTKAARRRERGAAA